MTRSHSTNATQYVGRFAPSPSGPLHMGSLVCALASYLEAKSQGGRWLVRMEDIDPPREQQGAARAILHTLEQHAFTWDGDVLFQSTRTEAYEETLRNLHARQLSYRCTCTRARLKPLGHIYDGYCRDKRIDNMEPSSIRINVEKANKILTNAQRSRKIVDKLQGEITLDSQVIDDFIVKRKDQLYAYQLAVVVDDIAQNITHIVRGYDLFDCTRAQDYFITLLGGKSLNYMHIPVIVNADANKLSKQNHAPAIDNSQALQNIHTALTLLRQNPPNLATFKNCHDILLWAVEHWNIGPLTGLTSIPIRRD